MIKPMTRKHQPLVKHIIEHRNHDSDAMLLKLNPVESPFICHGCSGAIRKPSERADKVIYSQGRKQTLRRCVYCYPHKVTATETD